MKTKFSLFMIIIFGLAFIVHYFTPVRQIGDWDIHKNDVIQRNAVSKFYFPKSKNHAGQAQLERSAIYLKIMESFGVTITNVEVLAEAERIKQQTLDPEGLLKIKAIFKNDEQAYLKNYVKPLLIDRVIAYEFFPNHAEIHKESLALALNLIAKTEANPATFSEIARKLNIPLKRVKLTMNQGLLWQEQQSKDSKEKSNSKFIDQSQTSNPDMLAKLKNKMIQSKVNEARTWYEDFVKVLNDGQVFPKPINLGQSWLVLRRLNGSIEKGFHLQIGIIQKLDFSIWVEHEKKKLNL